MSKRCGSRGPLRNAPATFCRRVADVRIRVFKEDLEGFGSCPDVGRQWNAVSADFGCPKANLGVLRRDGAVEEIGRFELESGERGHSPASLTRLDDLRPHHPPDIGLNDSVFAQADVDHQAFNGLRGQQLVRGRR